MKTHCPGCGVPFQTEKPGDPGFLPPEAVRRGNPICQRCYKLRHYGRLESPGLDDERLRNAVRKAAAKTDLAVLVVDLFDLEGSLSREWLDLLPCPVVLALNKIDLLPPKTPVREAVAAAARICRQRLPGLQLREVVPVSAKTGVGISALKDRISLRRGEDCRIGFFGVTNTGKSSLLANFLPDDRSGPTISNIPGTTQGATSWYITDMDVTLSDTPGWTPGTRLPDKLCPACAGKLVIKERVPSKYLELSKDTAVMLGAYAVLEGTGETGSAISIYASGGVMIHKTNRLKAGELCNAPPAWLARPCGLCRSRLNRRIQEFNVPAGSDLFVSGLGWFAVRKAGTSLRLSYPEGVEVGVRQPTLFGGKGSDVS